MPRDYPFIPIGLTHNLCIVSTTFTCRTGCTKCLLWAISQKTFLWWVFGLYRIFMAKALTVPPGENELLPPVSHGGYLGDVCGPPSYSFSGVVGGERSAAYTPSFPSHLSNTFPVKETRI